MHGLKPALPFHFSSYPVFSYTMSFCHFHRYGLKARLFFPLIGDRAEMVRLILLNYTSPLFPADAVAEKACFFETLRAQDFS